ncbi:unnamed protein product [Schistosoma margrebowiei]|uniref:Uncharacterized protein n=1 Tax=Schistosoma margrebowiei TaxID=48269 RepID=A0A183N9J8_9TREM|nr:unnamed protein product [Schistosoma margrebowiei]
MAVGGSQQETLDPGLVLLDTCQQGVPVILRELVRFRVTQLHKTGKTSQIATEMRKYNLAVLGIRETHWTQAGQKRLNTGEMLLYSGHEEENAPHTQGVALMLSKVARNALVGWESHGSRIIKASFKTKKEGILMNIIQCYAPTNDSNDDIKDQFYERLQRHNISTQAYTQGYMDLTGPHYREPVDHICINKKFRRTMEDVRTRRRAEVASDHHLVVANLKLKLKKNWTTGQTALQRFNKAFLRDTDKLNEFKIALNNRFQALQDLLKEGETTIEDN